MCLYQKWQNSVPESVTTTPAKIPRNGVNCIGTGVSANKINLVKTLKVGRVENLENLSPFITSKFYASY